MSKERMVAYTDAIIAIIITLMVLNIHAPTSFAWSALAPVAKQWIVYLMSFILLSIFLVKHNLIFRSVGQINFHIMWLNNFVIFALTLIPFVTEWLCGGMFQIAPEIMYAIVLIFINSIYVWLVNLLLQSADEAQDIMRLKMQNRISFVMIAENIVAIILSLLFNLPM